MSVNVATYQVTVQDIIKAQRLHFRRTFFTWWLVAACLILGLFFASIFGPIDESVLSRRSLSIGIPSGLAIFGLLWFFCWMILPFQARQIWRQGEKMWQRIDLTWGDDGLRMSCASGDWTHMWDEFYRWAEDGLVILLYAHARLFYILPLRAFPDGAALSIAGYLEVAGVKKR